MILVSCTRWPTHVGIPWRSDEELLEISCMIMEQEQATKRIVASTIAMIFDLMDWMLPLLNKSKVFLRSLWRDKFDWDTALPPDRKLEWQRICECMNGFKKLNPRFLSMKHQQASLSTFADASNEAMAASVYLQSEESINLLFGKSKLPSLKHEATIPKMELNAMTLAVRVTNAVLTQLQSVMKIRQVYIFSDSESYSTG
ncbi:hypothetical protein RB195_006130 [Necator americanus]|uniref:Pao retrotransposon peptidase n=1 Tax=Necator americanus TaxID=51031 RepID=A0ABR1BR44_NECAM